jgi:hypothetical protein
MRAHALAAVGVAVTIALGVSTKAPGQSKNPSGVAPIHYQCHRTPDAQGFKERAAIGAPALLCVPSLEQVLE